IKGRHRPRSRRARWGHAGCFGESSVHRTVTPRRLSPARARIRRDDMKYARRLTATFLCCFIAPLLGGCGAGAPDGGEDSAGDQTSEETTDSTAEASSSCHDYDTGYVCWGWNSKCGWVPTDYHYHCYMSSGTCICFIASRTCGFSICG